VKRDARRRVPRRPPSLLCISSGPRLNRVICITSRYRLQQLRDDKYCRQAIGSDGSRTDRLLYLYATVASTSITHIAHTSLMQNVNLIRCYTSHGIGSRVFYSVYNPATPAPTITCQESPADIRVTRDSAVIPRWPSAAVLNFIDPDIASFDPPTPKT